MWSVWSVWPSATDQTVCTIRPRTGLVPHFLATVGWNKNAFLFVFLSNICYFHPCGLKWISSCYVVPKSLPSSIGAKLSASCHSIILFQIWSHIIREPEFYHRCIIISFWDYCSNINSKVGYCNSAHIMTCLCTGEGSVPFCLLVDTHYYFICLQTSIWEMQIC